MRSGTVKVQRAIATKFLKFIEILNNRDRFGWLILMMFEVFIGKVAAREFCYELISEVFV